MEAGSDQELIRAAQEDPNAFAALYEKYVDRIFQFIYYRVGNQQDVAEDLTAEAFTRALKTLSEFQWQGYPYSAYLYTVARSLCREWYTRNRPVESIDEVIVKDPQSLTAVTQADIALLWEKVRELPEDVQELLRLRYVEDLSYDDIAGLVNKKTGAIRTSISRAIDRLQELYEVETDY